MSLTNARMNKALRQARYSRCRDSLLMNEKMNISDAKAEALEKAGLWRRAARCWLEVLDSVLEDKQREKAEMRRDYCTRMAAGRKPDTRLADE